MFQNLSPHARRLINSAAYSALVVLAIGLGYLTFHAISERRQHGAETAAAGDVMPLLDLSSFSARNEKSSDGERLNVAFRIRLTAPDNLSCFVYIIARNDHVAPRLWAVWPTQGPGGAVSAGGHFRGGTPSTGQALQLSPSWTRVSATIPHPRGEPPFDTAIIYIVTATGEVLLERPFAL
jgi:hypothetical protein